MNLKKRFTGNISRDLAKEMIKGYEPRRKEHQSRIGKEDTKSIYISKKELVAFINANDSAEGVRIYFGVVGDYGIREQNQAHLKKYKDQTTIILMPTESVSKLKKDASAFIIGAYIEGEPVDENDLCPPPSTVGGSCIEIL